MTEKIAWARGAGVTPPAHAFAIALAEARANGGRMALGGPMCPLCEASGHGEQPTDSNDHQTNDGPDICAPGCATPAVLALFGLRVQRDERAGPMQPDTRACGVVMWIASQVPAGEPIGPEPPPPRMDLA